MTGQDISNESLVDQDVTIVMLAKAPIPGFAKTRLIPALGEIGAGVVAQNLLKHAFQQAISTTGAKLHLALTPGPADSVWQEYSELVNLQNVELLTHQLSLSQQADGDLGQRLIAACQQLDDDQQSIVVMGTDCPALDSDLIEDAIDKLKQYDAILQPVHDGGYALLAMKQFNRQVFENIRWSSEATAEDTRQQFRKLGWSWYELNPVSDIDEGDDLIHCPREWLKDLEIEVEA